MLTPTQIMQHCLELSRAGAPEAFPNPLVGAALVLDGEIIASGYHQRCGGPHAEVNLLAAFQRSDIPAGAILYVTLEPCSHHGRTPPCVDLVLKRGIRHVVVATEDVFPAVAGQGIARLRAAGVQVEVGLLRQEARELNARFFIFHRLKRPYLVLKWAQSHDGFIAPHPAGRLQLSNDEVVVRAHRWRADVAAVMVGTETARIDDPELTVRRVVGKQPLRIVIDRHGRLPSNLKLFKSGEVKTLVVGYGQATYPAGVDHYTLTARGVGELPELLAELYRRGVQSVMVEGGAALLNALIEQELWDEARIIAAPPRLSTGIAAPKISGARHGQETVGDNELVFFHHPQRSARLGLTAKA